MYLYHANALALGGTYTHPFQEVIPAYAGCSLSMRGGAGTSRSTNINFKEVIKCDLAQADVNGGTGTKMIPDDKGGVASANTYVTSVSVVVEGLNILNMFTADRIVARLAAEHVCGEPEPEIITTGCHYDNLRIAGHAVEVTTAHDAFSEFATYADCQKAWTGTDEARKKRLSDRLMGNGLNPVPVEGDPQHLKDVHRGYTEQMKPPSALRSTVLCSFVKAVNNLASPEITNCGSIIRVPQFGTIYLGEVVITAGQRKVCMFRLELGSPDVATITGPPGTSNGSSYP